MPILKGYGFGEDDIFKKPSNTISQSPLNVAMDNQPGGTFNLSASGSMGQAQNNTKGLNQKAQDIINNITSKPDWKDDIKQDEMDAGTDDPFDAVAGSGGTTGSSVDSSYPGAPQGSTEAANFGNDDTASGSSWNNPSGADSSLLNSTISQSMLQSGAVTGGAANLKATNITAGTTSPLEDAMSKIQDNTNIGLGTSIDDTAKNIVSTKAPDDSGLTGPTDTGGTQDPGVGVGIGADATKLSLADALQQGTATYTDPYQETAGGEPPPEDTGDQDQGDPPPGSEANTTNDEDTGGANDDDDTGGDDDDDGNGNQNQEEQKEDPRFGLTDIERGTDLSTILRGLGYEPEILKERFGEMFESYDPTREGFTEAGLGLDLEQRDLAKGQALTARDRATEQTQRQADLLSDQLGKEGYLAKTLDRQQRSLGLREDLANLGLTGAEQRLNIAKQRTGLQRGLLESELGTIDVETGLRTGGRMAQDLAREQRRIDIQEAGLRESAEERQQSISDQLGRLGGQRRGLDLSQGAARGDARASLFDAYAGAANTGGFAGGGARMAAAQRATERTADLYQRQADRTGIARDDLGIQEEATRRQSGLIESLLSRQLDSLSLNRDQTQSSYDRKQGQLGAQLGGLDLADKSAQTQYDQTAGGLKSQLGQYGIQGEGLTAAYNEQTGKVKSQLTGLESELGPEGYLQKAYEDQVAGLDLGYQRRELGADVDLYGQREDYREKIGDRLIDLIQSEADLSGTKLSDDERMKLRVGQTKFGDDGQLNIWDGNAWLTYEEYMAASDK